jgi:hypothetical protein
MYLGFWVKPERGTFMLTGVFLFFYENFFDFAYIFRMVV